MKPQEPNKGTRPGFVILLVCSVAAIMASIWLYAPKPPPTKATVEATPAPEPAAAAVPVPAAQPVAPTPSTALEEKWGIQVSSVELTMEGSAVDLRYRVVAPEKAAPLAQGETTAYLIDQASGKTILMAPPEAAALPLRSRARMMRQQGAFPPSLNRLASGTTNSILLPNPGGIVKSGSLVAVVVGDARMDNVTVE